MKYALMLDANDIKGILAEHFNVPESSIIRSQYSYIVAVEKGEQDVKQESNDTK